MKANELMIGDWVGYLPTWKNEDGSIGRDGDPNDPIPFKVEMVCWNCVVLDDWEGGSFDADDISLYPIPLTCEILEKNGFVYDDLPMSQYFEQYGLQLYYGGNGFRINCGINVSLIIDSVHELQHTMRLCGIEKEIEI